MIAQRMPRMATALLILGLCLFTGAGAVSMLRLAAAEMAIDGSTPAQAATAAARLAPLCADPVVGPRARARLLSLSDVHDTRNLQWIEDLLADAPLASGGWRNLARARLQAGAPIAAVVTALAMARVTGPNEGHEMAARASFGAPLWAMLPIDARNGLIRDLVGGWAEMPGPERAALRVTLALARPETRTAVGAGLRRAGKAGVSLAQALGLGGAVVVGR
jgi:hypothetical protein